MVEDQKKRALEALERRFAVAKAQAQHQLVMEKKCRLGPFSKSGTGSSLVVPSVEESPAFVQNTSFKKDFVAEGLTYSYLCQPVHGNLLTAVETCDKGKTTVDKILHELLQKGDSAEKYAQGSRSIKVDNWILLDNFVLGNSTSVARLRQNSKRSKKHMSMKQLKKCGLLDLTQALHKFELFMPMHEMWKNYVMQLMKNIGKNNVAQSLLAADLHGAIFQVAECEINMYLGLVGVMIRETAETFGLITRENYFRVVPKRNSVFVFQADCWRITLRGDKCISRKLDTF